MLEEYTAAANRPCLPAIHSMGSLPALLRTYGKILGWTFRFIPLEKDEIPADLTKALASELYKTDFNSDVVKTRIDSAEAVAPRFPALKIHSDNSAEFSDYTEFNCLRKESELFSSFQLKGLKYKSIPVEIKTGDGRNSVVGKVDYYPNNSVWDNLQNLARQAAAAIADIVGELLSTRYQLWRRESELAAKSAAPIGELGDREIAFLLQNILRGGAEGLNCQAGAMYLLDDETSELKMRSCWGLPAERLQDPARPLGDAAADLEAMLGHAVAMEDSFFVSQWRAPEDFPAALCVPLLSESTILGTVWFYSVKPRRFTNKQTQLAEIIAGRLATELEREALLENYIQAENWKKEIQSAAQIQKNQLPISAPWIENWDLAGKMRQANDFGGNFYDWFTLPNGKVVCALGECQRQGLAAALVAGSVKTAFRCHAPQQGKVDSLVEQIDRTIWSTSAADQYANLFCAQLDMQDDKIFYSTAGNQRIFLVGENGVRDFSQKSPLLGVAPQSEYIANCVRIAENEALVVLSDKIGSLKTADGKPMDFDALLENVRVNLNRNAKFSSKELFGWLECMYSIPPQTDYSLLVIKRGKSR